MKNFIYLIQGKAELISSNFQEIKSRADADVIFLTYDKPSHGAIFFPNSTWAQGRNKLLSEALKADKDYLYYIFLDDDIAFETGNWDLFEKQLLKHHPAIATPVTEKTYASPVSIRMKGLYIPFINFQPFQMNDEQCLAFHRDVVRDALVIPYQERFDYICWWCSCDIQEILIQTFYYPYTLQFNNIVIKNELHRNYPKNNYKNDMEDWLFCQFSTSLKYPRSWKLHICPVCEFITLIRCPRPFVRTNIKRLYFLYKRLTYNKKTTYRIPEKLIQQTLKPYSDLYSQHLKQQIKNTHTAVAVTSENQNYLCSI